jgi:hypothetical protein
MSSTVLPVSAAELASIRADLTAAVCDTPCVQKRATKTPDAYGTSTESLSTIATFNIGLEKPSGGLLTEFADLIASQRTWLTHCPYGQDVRQKDQLIVSGKTLIVQELLDLQSMAGLHDVLVTEIA